jgi:hypothetical protein
MDKEYGYNASNSVLKIRHSSLLRMSEDSDYRVKCPVCETGALLVHRDQKTLMLAESDHCIVCGQHVKYLDIQEMREKES